MSAHQPSQSNSWTQQLIDLLGRQRSQVDQLHELAQSQASCIEDGKTDRLLDLLARRQSIIDQFAESQALLGELTHGLEARLDQAGAEDRQRIKSLITEIGDRLNQVMRRDEQDQATLRQRRDVVKGEISAIGTARQARTAYVPTSPRRTRFADQHG